MNFFNNSAFNNVMNVVNNTTSNFVNEIDKNIKNFPNPEQLTTEFNNAFSNNGIDKIADDISQNINQNFQDIEKNFENIAKEFENATNEIVRNIPQEIEKIGVDLHLDNLPKEIESMTSEIVKNVEKIPQEINNVVGDLTSEFVKLPEQVIDGVDDIVKDVIADLNNTGVGDKLKFLTDALEELQTLEKTINSGFDKSVKIMNFYKYFDQNKDDGKVDFDEAVDVLKGTMKVIKKCASKLSTKNKIKKF